LHTALCSSTTRWRLQGEEGPQLGGRRGGCRVGEEEEERAAAARNKMGPRQRGRREGCVGEEDEDGKSATRKKGSAAAREKRRGSRARGRRRDVAAREKRRRGLRWRLGGASLAKVGPAWVVARTRGRRAEANSPQYRG